MDGYYMENSNKMDALRVHPCHRKPPYEDSDLQNLDLHPECSSGANQLDILFPQFGRSNGIPHLEGFKQPTSSEYNMLQLCR